MAWLEPLVYAALLYGSTGDAEVKARGDAIVTGIAERQAKLAAGGYVSAFPETEFERLEMGQKVWAPFIRCTS